MFILLIGMSGSGRTTVGSSLAQKLGYEFVEMDNLVLEESGFETIQEVYNYRTSFWKEGELDVCKRLALEKDLVIACSGGVVENQLNFLYFEESKQPFCIVYLKASEEQLVDRILEKEGKLSKREFEKLEKRTRFLIDKRNLLCKEVADVVIDTNELNVEQVCDKIIKKLDNCERESFA